MPKVDEALALAARGFHVFPVSRNSKLPAIKEWQNAATTNADKIREWWGEREFNIGICTTRYFDDAALIVVDVDNKDERAGDDTVFSLEIEGRDFPPTMEVRTPNGGRHLIYKSEKPVKQGTNILGPGVDIRSSGGYIVAVGSTLATGVYAPTNAADVAPAPEWLPAQCGLAKTRAAKPAPQLREIDQDNPMKRAIDYLEGLETVTEGDRNHAGFKAACTIKDYGVTRNNAEWVMGKYWRCEPPLEAEEFKQVIRSAYQYGKDAPGILAPEAVFDKVAPDTTAPATKDPFEKLNSEFAFVIAGGGAHILWETQDAKGREKLEHLNLSAFHQKFASKKMMLGKKEFPVTQLWMEHPKRRSYDGLAFAPSGECDPRFYNLWRGFAVTPAPVYAPNDAVKNYLGHILENVCGKDRALFDWLISYFAHMVQRPWEKPLTALVFRGGKGVGKNVAVEFVGRLLGNHCLVTSNRRFLLGNFNGHMENLLLMVLDEAIWSGDKQMEGQLKDLITGKEHVIEHKGKEPYTVANLTRVAILGNEDWLVPASADERRFAVFDVGDGRKQDIAFFTAMREGLEAGGFEMLLRYLLDVDLSKVDINQAPATKGLLAQKTMTLDPFCSWWYDCLSDEKILGADFSHEWPDEIGKDKLRTAYLNSCKLRNLRTRGVSSREFGSLLRRVLPQVDGTQKRRDGAVMVNVYRLPNIDACRTAWETYIGHKVQWGT